MRLGTQFPEERVGKKWTASFIEKYSERLSTYNARSLETVCGRAVNPSTNNAWFDLLGEVLKTGDDGSPIAPECIIGADEAGFMPEVGSTMQWAIGGQGKKVQYEQRGGGRQNTTAIVGILADGTSIPPVVIMKGQF